MSNSVQPHRWQPTKLCHPWDSPGKNTGVGCHFLLQCVKVKSKKWKWSRQLCRALCNPMDCSLCPQDFPGKSTGVGCHCLLQTNEWLHHKELATFQIFKIMKLMKQIKWKWFLQQWRIFFNFMKLIHPMTLSSSQDISKIW